MYKDIDLLNKLKEIRKKNKMTQTDLAKEVGVSRNTITSIETYQYYPSARLAKKLCIVLNCKFEELFYFSDEIIDKIKKKV